MLTPDGVVVVGGGVRRIRSFALLSLFLLVTCICSSSISTANNDVNNITEQQFEEQQEQHQQNGVLTSQDFLVVGLEEQVPAFGTFDGQMYAGLLSTTPLLYDGGDEKEENIIKSSSEIQKREGGDIFFWLLEPHHPTVDDTFVIWLNGGPGCSSIAAGMLFETGPVTVPLHAAGVYNADLHPPLQRNAYGWTNATTIMYVEQPVGTGFTSGPVPENEQDVAQDFYYFLQNLFHIFPHLRSKRLFFFGESYAGMFVPSIGHYIYQANTKILRDEEKEENKEDDNNKDDTKSSSSSLINLAGIALGNGWIDVRVQGPATIDYAWWHGMIDSVTRDFLHQEWRQCFPMSKVHPPFHHFTVPDECGIMEVILAEAGGGGLLPWGLPNEYDVTTFDRYPSLFDNSINGTFGGLLNNPKVRQALNVHNDKFWQACIPGAGRRRLNSERESDRESSGITIEQQHYHHHHHRHHHHHSKNLREEDGYLDDDVPISVVPYIAELLDDAKIKVLIYNGDRDLSTCAQGSEILLNSMKWKGSKRWVDPLEYQRGLWLVQQHNHSHQNEMAGYAKSLDNLTFLIVYNSGHLLPYNQPRNALDLLTRFLRNESYVNASISNHNHINDAMNNKRKKFEHLDGFEQLQQGEGSREESMYLSEGGFWVAWVAGAAGFVGGVMFAFVMPKLTFKRSQYHRL